VEGEREGTTSGCPAGCRKSLAGIKVPTLRRDLSIARGVLTH
jgi:hypothetical protein